MGSPRVHLEPFFPILSIVLLLLAGFPAAGAQSPCEQELIRQGKRLYEDGLFVEAEQVFLEASHQRPSCERIRLYLGMSRQKQGAADKAAAAWQDLRAFLAQGGEVAGQAEARQSLAELEAQLRTTHTLLHLESTPAGAELRMGQPPLAAGLTPLDLWLPRGRCRFELWLPGHRAEPREIEVGPDAAQRLHLTLQLDLPELGSRSVPPPRTVHPWRWVALISGGLTLVSAAGGAYAWHLAQEDAAQARGLEGSEGTAARVQWRELSGAARDEQRAASMLLGVAGAAAATSLVALLLDAPWKGEGPGTGPVQARFCPWPGVVGVALRF